MALQMAHLVVLVDYLASSVVALPWWWHFPGTGEDGPSMEELTKFPSFYLLDLCMASLSLPLTILQAYKNNNCSFFVL